MEQFKVYLSIFLTLFAVIDIVGSIPLIISVKKKHGNINPFKITLYAAVVMTLFLLVGESLLGIFGIDVGSFAVAGSIVLFIIGLEMILGHDFFKSDDSQKGKGVVPLVFPVIAGTGTLTTILSLKANYDTLDIAVGIGANLILVLIVLYSTKYIEKLLGEGGIALLRKIFGIILLSIALKLFGANIAKVIS
jgi:multiple antibiotic resistance protein